VLDLLLQHVKVMFPFFFSDRFPHIWRKPYLKLIYQKNKKNKHHIFTESGTILQESIH